MSIETNASKPAINPYKHVGSPGDPPLGFDVVWGWHGEEVDSSGEVVSDVGGVGQGWAVFLDEVLEISRGA